MRMFLSGLILILFTLLGHQNNQIMDEEQLQQTHYCEMVELFKSSNGENGWPDYKGTYEKECKK